MSMSEFIGQTLGQYRIEVPIDAGGMGQVYRGVHIYLNRPAAIKVMRPHLAANPSFRERFLQEARSAAALKHQNIVDIYEFGEQDEQLYLVMELVPDGSLRTLMHRRTKQPWPLELGLDLMRQAAKGLAAAHAQNVIHRDIKPDNMLLQRLKTPEPFEYQLKISDFGLARLAEGSGLTATGAPLGTLAYMSPEQCLGGKIDGRTDLYSLGVVIYEIATGYQPFQIENFDDAIRKHTQAIPTPPSQVRSGLPPSLEPIILRCLAKKPEDRYQTGTELARDLQAILQNAEIRTLGASAPSLVSPTPRENTAVREDNNTPAPLVATLQGYSAQPRVRVLDQSGQTLQVAEVTSQGITIGRQAGNAIVIPSEEISRQHVRVQLNNGQVTITDLGSSNGTILENVRLQPNVSSIWPDHQMVHIGPYWLRLEGATSDATRAQSFQRSVVPPLLSELLPTAAARPVPANQTYNTGGGRIGVRIDPTSLTITPGQPANVRVTLTNLGTLVDWLTVTAEGVAREWVRGPGAEVQLNPGMQETVDLGVNVARSPENLAQDYPVVIRARSREKPAESGIAQARWTVLPFTENAIRVEPRRVRGRGKGRYSVTVTNHGNVPVRHELKGEDDEQKLLYQFGNERLSLDPGNETRIPLTIVGQRRLIGKDQSQRFQLLSRPASSASAPSYTTVSPLSTNAEFVNHALIPPWVLTVVGIALALALVVGSLFASRSNPQVASMLPPFMQAPTTATGGGAPAPALSTPPSNAVAPMAITPPAATPAPLPTMQAMTAPATAVGATRAFVQQTTSANSNNNFTVITNKFTNNTPAANFFVTQNATPPGSNGPVLNSHAEGVWFENANWAVFNEDTKGLTPQAAFNVWIPKNASLSFVQQATSGNISGSATTIDNQQVNNKQDILLFVTQNWNPNGRGGVFNPHPIGVAFSNGSWSIFNEDGAAMAPQASFNVHVLTAGTTNFVQAASATNVQNGGLVIDNATINGDQNAIILVTQVWNPGGNAGVYNNHPVGVAFDGKHWNIINEDQTPMPQGASFNVSIVQK